eukprot:gene36416-49054_t
MGSSNTKFTIDDIPNLTGKVIIVTGGNAGIGYGISKALALKGAHVIIASRNETKINKAAEDIKKYVEEKGKSTPNISTYTLELSSFTSIKSFATKIKSNFDHIDVLINNAGIFLNPYAKSEQGFELTLGTNGFGTAYLTNLLLPLVIKSTEGRIVILSSGAIGFVSSSGLNKAFEDIGGKNVRESNLDIYALSKYYNTAYAEILQEKLNEKGINNVSVFSVHPGAVKSDALNKSESNFVTILFSYVLLPLLGVNADTGAISTLYAATSPNALIHKGKMFDEGPVIKLYKTPATYTLDNAHKIFNGINKEIETLGFESFKI